MKKKLMVYPYNYALDPLIRHQDLLVNGYELFSVVTALDAGLCGKTISGSDFKVTTDYCSALKGCDAVFFNEWHGVHYQYDKLYEKINRAVDMGKEIIIQAKLEKNFIFEIEQKCKKNNTAFTDLQRMDQKVEATIPARLKNIHTPVIFIGSLTSNCNKFEIQLALRKLFIQNGYQVSQVGTKNYCELFGFHSFPKFMFSKEYSEVDKILLFNQWIYDMEKKERPDLMMIGVPGSILTFKHIIHNNFGIMPYLVSQAVHPDFAVISALFHSYPPEFFERMNRLVTYKLGFKVDCFNVSDRIMDFYQNENFEKEKFIYVTTEMVDEVLAEIRKSAGLHAINIYNHRDVDFLYRFIIDLLSNPANEGTALNGGVGA